MTSEFSPELARELLDDFYTECDEQLGTLRTLLIEIEGQERRATPASFEPLFRTMHSLKGNAAIVGLREVEELAHVAESFLKGLTQGTSPLTDTGFDTLQRTVHRLEQIIGAHRQKAALPAVEDLVISLKLLVSGKADASDAARTAKTFAPEETGAPSVYRFIFSPSRDLDARGVNINTVRTRLTSLGKIMDSKPVIGGGTMSFELTVETAAVLDAREWETVGVTFSRVDGAAPASGSHHEAAPLAAAAADEQGAALFIAPSHIMRVDISRLDDLLRIAGELVIHRSRLDDRLNHDTPDKGALKEVNLALARSLRELREAITRVRLVPIAEVFARLPFVVRDLAHGSSKKARLVVEGKHTEIDKYVVERLKEPLLHLVRNAFSHGIETPDVRAAAGKPPEGTITLSAAAEGGFVVIKVSDDGGGVDAARVVAKARKLKIPTPEVVDDKAILDLLCAPGFSIREETDLAAGRGVGMSVVKGVVQELGGTLSLQSSIERGTDFTLRLPLTLSIMDTLLVSVGGEICAVPQHVVQEIVEVRDDALQSIRGTQIIPYRDGVLPVVHLGKVFGAANDSKKTVNPVLVIRSDEGFAGLIVERVISQREVVVRPMEDPLIQARGIAGATELGDGRPVLILDALALLEGAIRPLSAADRSSSNILATS
jgi:two-component system chemotaxis sensor kinase CheA